MNEQPAHAALRAHEESRGTLTIFNELLKHPVSAIARVEEGGALPSVWLFVGSLICYVIYGAAAGLFQGGSQVLLASLKAPLIILGTLVLCAPSFYVFGTLAGADLSGRRFLGLLSRFCGMLGLLMLGLLPISWLFTVSSNSLLFVVWLHVLVWWVALLFALRFLVIALGDPRARGALFLWLILFSVVSYQVTTYARPILWREPGTPVFEQGKMLFLEHLGQVARSARKTNPADNRGG